MTIYRAFMIVVSDVKIHSKIPMTEAKDIPSISPAETKSSNQVISWVYLRRQYRKAIESWNIPHIQDWHLSFDLYSIKLLKGINLTQIKHHGGHDHWVTVLFPAPLRVILPILNCFMMSADAFFRSWESKQVSKNWGEFLPQVICPAHERKSFTGELPVSLPCHNYPRIQEKPNCTMMKFWTTICCKGLLFHILLGTCSLRSWSFQELVLHTLHAAESNKFPLSISPFSTL